MGNAAQILPIKYSALLLLYTPTLARKVSVGYAVLHARLTVFRSNILMRQTIKNMVT